MNVRLTDDAAHDLESIKAWIAKDNLGAAKQTIERIRKTIRLLSEWPYFGHDGIVEGTSEFVVSQTPYVIVYRIDTRKSEETLTVLRVPHGAQNRSENAYEL